MNNTQNKNNTHKVSINGQHSLYLYSILQDINKFKVLLVFMNKNFTWLRELRSFGIFSKIIEETLNEFNNLGLIELKELSELPNDAFEAFVTVKHDMQYYFKVYFATPKLHQLVSKHKEDCLNVIDQNEHLNDFIDKVKGKLQPFLFQMAKIREEEQNQFSRKITLNGISFEKDTKKALELKKILQIGRSKNTALVVQEPKPLALMSEVERKRHTNKIIHNGKEVNSSIFREQEEKDRAAETDFKTGTVGKSEAELEIQEEKRQAALLEELGIL